MSIVLLPIPKKEKLDEWAAQLTVALKLIFDNQLSHDPGEIILWPAGVDVPFRKFLECDGATYPSATYPALAKILGESAPGEFDVPTVTPPSGSIAVIRA